MPTSLRVERPGNWGSITLQGKGLLSSLQRPDWHWGPASLLCSTYMGSCPETKRVTCEADQSLRSGAEAKKASSYALTVPYLVTARCVFMTPYRYSLLVICLTL